MKKSYLFDAFRFCPLCSKKLNLKGDHVECGSCGHKIFDSAVPAVNVIIEVKSGIVLVERRIEPYKGWWDFPGGFINGGETLESAAKREIKEELGVDISIGRFIGSYEGEYEYRGFLYKLIVMFVEGKSGTSAFKAGDDVTRYKFVPPQNALEEKICYPEINQKALKKYLSL